jgi:hypothetical protein
MLDFTAQPQTFPNQFPYPPALREFPPFPLDGLIHPADDAPCTDGKDLSYKDFVVNWVAAEAVSPTLRHLYKGLSARLLAKIREYTGSQAGYFTADEIARMEKILRQARGCLFQFYGITPSLSFRKARVTLDSLKGFNVMKPFVGNWPSFGMWADYELLTGKFGMMHDVAGMAKMAALGVNPTGCPIAILPNQGPAILIEGYKRSLLALQQGVTAVDIMVCLGGA